MTYLRYLRRIKLNTQGTCIRDGTRTSCILPRGTPSRTGVGNCHSVALSLMVTLPYLSFLSFHSCRIAAEAVLALTRFLLGIREWPRRVLEATCWKLDACLSTSKARMAPCWFGFCTLRSSCSKTPGIASTSRGNVVREAA
jgi:hypothetical protein